ncbi:MAG: ABC transporter permease [Acidimicrobiales bacterium]
MTRLARGPVGYLARRLVGLAAVWLGISALAFLIGHLAPGNPATAILSGELGRLPTHAEVVAFDHHLGLDSPLVLQYLHWLVAALHGNLGTSYLTSQGVFALLAARIPATLVLAASALSLSVAVAVPLGIWAALRSSRLPDSLTRALAVGSSSLPSFWVGYLLIIAFAVVVPLLPAQGSQGLASLILPVVTLALSIVGVPLRLVRTSVLEVLGQDYVRTARAVGLLPRTVLWRHVLRNALIPVVTYLGLVFGFLLSGTVIVETVFAWPGVGLAVTTAIHNRDYPVIQGFVLLTGTIFVVINLVVDLAYAYLDPRVRLGGAAIRGIDA